ncbi:hypothetical protein LTS08_002212 [Lithohypha guttulata]|uniref:uncharacterized protein n=1 Tax=Lithohypha guttulata TaxID=1690604 RepID=UPI002DE0A089|nr:hypothetical protein LTR51_004272 [Lithohypha guttulata]KAK5104324.1 hypothetical protein LTS08_002212 [Lithohypha guttulata]
MPPKKQDPDSQVASDINALAIMMATATEFNPDYNAVARELGISHGKNVPRKMDTILKQAGYQLKNKKVVKIDEDGAPTTPKVKEPKTPGGTDDEDGKPTITKKSIAKKPASKKGVTPKRESSKSPTKKAPATPQSKKRKLSEDIDEEDEDIKTEKSDEDDDDKDEDIDDDGDEAEEWWRHGEIK